MFRRYMLYLIRWQLSTPILAVCLAWFIKFGNLWSTVIANFIGGLIFFWVDRFIFSKRFDRPIWEIRERSICTDCGSTARGYRLVVAGEYDRRNDPTPEFRCEKCSELKAQALQETGVSVE